MAKKFTKKQPLQISKIPTGITGFDEATEGGLPRGRVTLLMGGTGSGKTVLALQTLVNGARDCGEPGIFVAFEENARQIMVNAASFTWGLPKLGDEKLFIFDALVTPDLVPAGGFDLAGMLAGLKAKAEEMGARRIVFDSVDVLLMLLNDSVAERQEVYRLCDWLVENELTGILTMKLDPLEPATAGYGFMQFRSDCVVLLKRRMVSRFSMRELQVLKYRGSAHSDANIPFAILPSGIEVASNDPRELEREASKERVSVGVKHLDQMLGGGYFRGSSTLITGAPGTGKSIMSGAFVEAACQRGERTLFVAFDENAEEIERNLSSVDIQIGAHLRSGMLRVYSARTEAAGAQVHLMKLKLLIDEFQPRCVVVDAISALIRAGDEETAEGVAERLLYLTRARGITTVCTSVVEDKAQLLGVTPIYVTTLVDTWIHVSYFIQGGQRNRSLTLIKSRGMKHSNQVCEMILRDEGISLADVYVSGGEVMMGTSRGERQKAEQAERTHDQAEIKRVRQGVDLAKAELSAQVETLRRALEMKETALGVLVAAEAGRETSLAQEREHERKRKASLDTPAESRSATRKGARTQPRKKGDAQ